MNAIDKPKFRIYSQQNLIDEVVLDLTNTAGLIETAIPIRNTHLLLNYSLTDKLIGWRIKWTFNYNEWTSVETGLNIQRVLRYIKQGFVINLIPRLDLPQRNFEVLYTGESIDYGVINNKGRFIGNRGIILEFSTKNIVQDLNWMNKDEIPYTVWTEEFAFIII